ncbi:twin-arginine translocation pathway signal protein [Thalassococcus sp. CAU 1522]|uniref:Twin-arginine translocation pathway signal protein n=1 Tax=Thalassococcus arenae TaxID=2851652 RepID=A0ABS6N336_9RHOB|nr:twin-arginine translocation pathway signal protein [Thalassococcus arenae]MBV2358436.1 twin-arginine translocation pathway signal protein [Thalassococcus arenae]
MTYSRRKTLGLIGGGTVLAATAGLGAFAASRTPARALAPWDMAGGYGDPRMNALSYALLAPNPHNRQPWQAELRGDDMVAIWRDPSRNLPVTDPFARQLTIGMGCFLDLMRMAAAQDRIGIEQTLFPEGESGPVALCRFVPDRAQPDPLFAHAMARRSHKDAFDPQPVTPAAAAPLAAYAEVFTGGDDADTLRSLAVEAWLVEASTQPAWQESIDLLRIGKAEINARPDGIDAGGVQLEVLARLGLFTREAASDPENPGSRTAIEGTRDAILGTPAFVLQTTPGNSRFDQIEVGARWLRLNLAATGAGLAVRPVSQVLQEYAEMAPLYQAIHTAYAPPGGTVQMLGLLGYAPTTPRTPRWALETRMRDA